MFWTMHVERGVARHPLPHDLARACSCPKTAHTFREHALDGRTARPDATLDLVFHQGQRPYELHRKSTYGHYREPSSVKASLFRRLQRACATHLAVRGPCGMGAVNAASLNGESGVFGRALFIEPLSGPLTCERQSGKQGLHNILHIFFVKVSFAIERAETCR